jgi:hypothetical protein
MLTCWERRGECAEIEDAMADLASVATCVEKRYRLESVLGGPDADLYCLRVLFFSPREQSF